jgi:hypothetical protein
MPPLKTPCVHYKPYRNSDLPDGGNTRAILGGFRLKPDESPAIYGRSVGPFSADKNGHARRFFRPEELVLYLGILLLLLETGLLLRAALFYINPQAINRKCLCELFNQAVPFEWYK